MLVLTRQCGEAVVLPGLEIELTVLEVRGHSVRVGITAPSRVGELRGELREADTRAAPGSDGRTSRRGRPRRR